MRDRWMALELGQRQLVAGLVAALLVVGAATGVAWFLHHDGPDHQKLDTAAGPSTSTTTTTIGATSSTTVEATSTTAAEGSSSTTTSTTTKGAHKVAKGAVATTTAPRARSTTSTTAARTTTTAAPAGPCSTGGGGQDDQIASLYCAYRRDQGLAPMSRNSALDGVAQKWAQKMASDADAAVAAGQEPSVALAHNLPSNPDATYPGGYSAAVKADCSRCTGWAENVAYDVNASSAWNGWLGSSAHLADIRGGPDGGEYGVGAAQGGGYWFYVQDFGFYP